ncbi:hypothetical protein OPV22_014637 [Ensete ventricosum]|uniref:Uncharacterized protein n=1 Tax=Ensete ventricosum TaxID=4639 RepID=A0AAV8RCC1_ENSVE|nr:hypothetical protein OPV22_014637 [Ensete ventricosum]
MEFLVSMQCLGLAMGVMLLFLLSGAVCIFWLLPAGKWRRLRKSGLAGPPPLFPLGNLVEMSKRGGKTPSPGSLREGLRLLAWNRAVLAMVSVMEETTKKMLTEWSELLARGQREIDVGKDVTKNAAEIIAKTSFGISEGNGEKLFEKLQLMQKILFQANRPVGVPCGKLMYRTRLGSWEGDRPASLRRHQVNVKRCFEPKQIE